MKSKLKTVFGCLVFIIIISSIFIGILFLRFKPNEICGNHIIDSKFSPNKKYKLLIFSRDCGATTGFSTQISIIDSNEILEQKDTGNVFIADDDHGKAKTKGEIINLNTRWINNENLVIEYPKNARIYKNDDSEKGINIIYKEIKDYR